MRESNHVTLKLDSVQDGVLHTHYYSGEWFRKERSIFIRYNEQEESGDIKTGQKQTRTMIRYRPDELFIARRGSIQLEQYYVPGVRRLGSYEANGARLVLETDTSRLVLHSDSVGKTMNETAGEIQAADDRHQAERLPMELPFMLEWEYELYVGDQLTGRFHNRLHIQEEALS